MALSLATKAIVRSIHSWLELCPYAEQESQTAIEIPAIGPTRSRIRKLVHHKGLL